MGYKLAASNGDTLAVPQLVLTHLTQTDGDTIRAALYILQTHDTDPRTMARALALPSIEAAKRTLQYWAGAGLLVSERGAAPAPAAEPARVCAGRSGQRGQRPLCCRSVPGGAKHLR